MSVIFIYGTRVSVKWSVLRSACSDVYIDSDQTASHNDERPARLTPACAVTTDMRNQFFLRLSQTGTRLQVGCVNFVQFLQQSSDATTRASSICVEFKVRQ